MKVQIYTAQTPEEAQLLLALGGRGRRMPDAARHANKQSVRPARDGARRVQKCLSDRLPTRASSLVGIWPENNAGPPAIRAIHLFKLYKMTGWLGTNR